MGFILTPDQARRMLDADPRNADVIYPYLNGEDLNSDPEQRPSRWVINFWDWPEERARTYELPWKWTEEQVKPERLSNKDKGAREKWWLFLRARSELYHAIGRGHHFERHPEGGSSGRRQSSRVLAITRVSKTLAFSFVTSNIVFSDATVVFSLAQERDFALLQSNIHAVSRGSMPHVSRAICVTVRRTHSNLLLFLTDSVRQTTTHLMTWDVGFIKPALKSCEPSTLA
jgi:hypothetical protein